MKQVHRSLPHNDVYVAAILVANLCLIIHRSITPTLQSAARRLYLIGMRQLDENVFERSAALSELAHGPAPFNGKSENLFAHISAGFDSQRESLPIVSAIGDYITNAGDFL